MKRPNLRNRTSNPLRHSLRRQLEALEGRDVPATISVAGAALNEIGNPSAFIAAGSGGLAAPGGITLGPDGNVYVTSNGGAILRYNGTTGAYISTFVSQGSGGLSGLSGNSLAFGPNGNLFISSQNTNQVLEYNGSTGAFIRVFVAASAGGLTNPRGLTFGPDGNLFVASFNVSSGANGIMRYQGPLSATPGSPLPASGESGANFVAQFEPMPPEPGGVSAGGPAQVIFGPDGSLYVDGGFYTGVNRYDGSTGAFLNSFIPRGNGGLTNGRGMAFDQEGRFYLSDSSNAIHRYDSAGSFLGDLLVNSVNPSLSRPAGIAFDTQGRLLITSNTSNNVVRYDRGVVATLSAANPTPVSVNYTTTDGSATAGSDYFALSGVITFNPGQTSRTILLATNEEHAIEGNETFSVDLSNPTGGATIGSGAATVTIVESTREVSVADTTGIENDHAAHYRGAFIQDIAGSQVGLPAFGPDGNFYIVFGAGPSAGGIGQFDGTTGEFIKHLVAPGTLAGGRDMAWSNGYLYVGEEYTNDVLRFDATTGAFDSVFVSPGSGGISGPHGLTIGPDGNLYVSGRNNGTVVRYDGATGAPLGTYVTSGSGGLRLPEGITFDPSGSYLYVASTGSSQVLKYNALTGAFVGVAASTGLSAPKSVKFGPDGLMYVASANNHRIMRFNASGAYVDDFVPAGSGGLSMPSRLTFGPDGNLYVSVGGAGADSSRIYRFGTQNEAIFTVSISTPSTLPLTVNYATADGAAIAGVDYTATSGTLTFTPGITTATIRVPLINNGTAEGNESFFLSLSAPVGATITDGVGAATVLDDDVTKFFVVDDSTTNATYRYGALGNGFGNSTLNAGNSAPRGAASNVAGDKVWVADANRQVYLYNSSGGLLGSWSAGSLNPSAQVEGITTNGTDIWIVDSKQDKVFRYAGAASRPSGSQNAASSFSLNNGNKNPKDLVTDGTSIWVIDDAATDKVFKYTLTGSLLGSWTITSGGGSPTGIALDPSNAQQHLWIVDNATDRVYQYENARARTTGSQLAGATFALVAGNSNPQGIADPPPPAMLLSIATDEQITADLRSPVVDYVVGPLVVDQSDRDTKRAVASQSQLVRTKNAFAEFLAIQPTVADSHSLRQLSAPSQLSTDSLDDSIWLGDEQSLTPLTRRDRNFRR